MFSDELDFRVLSTIAYLAVVVGCDDFQVSILSAIRPFHINPLCILHEVADQTGEDKLQILQDLYRAGIK